MSEKLATIRASPDAVEKLIAGAGLANQDEYEHILLTIMDGEVNVLSSGTGLSLSYATFHEGGAFYDIEVGESVLENTADGEAPLTEALIDVDMFLRYYDLIQEHGQTVRLEFHGEPDARLATHVEMYGGLNAKLHLPMNEKILEKVALGAPDRFDEDDVWDGEVRFDTQIRTRVEKIRQIIDAVDAPDITAIDNYPIVVEDGQFKLDATDGNQRNRISGVLGDDDTEVTGDDVAHLYGEKFRKVFNTLEGDVWLQTAAVDGGAPLAVVKQDDDGVIRHVIGPSGTL